MIEIKDVKVALDSEAGLVKAIDGEASGEVLGLTPHPALQAADKIPLVEEILSPLERAYARLELHHR